MKAAVLGLAFSALLASGAMAQDTGGTGYWPAGDEVCTSRGGYVSSRNATGAVFCKCASGEFIGVNGKCVAPSSNGKVTCPPGVPYVLPDVPSAPGAGEGAHTYQLIIRRYGLTQAACEARRKSLVLDDNEIAECAQ